MLMVAVGIGTGVGNQCTSCKDAGAAKSEKAAKVAGNSLFLGQSFMQYVCCSRFWSKHTFPRRQWIGGPFDGNKLSEICCVISFGIIYFSLFEEVVRATDVLFIQRSGRVVGAVVNMILDPIAVYGIGPVPEMGVRGAAYAAVIRRVSPSAILLFVFHMKLNKGI